MIYTYQGTFGMKKSKANYDVSVEIQLKEASEAENKVKTWQFGLEPSLAGFLVHFWKVYDAEIIKESPRRILQDYGKINTLYYLLDNRHPLHSFSHMLVTLTLVSQNHSNTLHFHVFHGQQREQLLFSFPKSFLSTLHSHSSSLLPSFYFISSIPLSLVFRIYYHSHTPPPCFLQCLSCYFCFHSSFYSSLSSLYKHPFITLLRHHPFHPITSSFSLHLLHKTSISTSQNPNS
ncbi:hypothetical protein ABKV19_021386 [Rosa sericea]